MRDAVTQSGSGPTVTGMVKMIPGAPKAGQLKVTPAVGGIEAVYPNNTTIRLVDDIVLQWSGTDTRGEKPVLVFFESGQKPQTFDLTAAQKQFSLNGKTLGLAKGKTYNWYLGRLEKGKPIAQSQKFSFQTLGEVKEVELEMSLANLKSLNPETPEGEAFLKAQVFYQYKMYDRMVAELEPLYATNKTGALKRLLFLGNIRMGKKAQAKQYASF